MAIALLQADAPKFCPNALRGILRSLFWIWTRHHKTSNNPICHILIDNWCVLLMNNCRYSIRKYPSWNLNTCELMRIGAFSCFMRIFIILLCRNGIPDSSSWIYAFFYRLNLIIRILLFSGTRTYEIILSSEYFCCLPWNDKNFNGSVFVFSVCLGRAHVTGLDLQFSLFCGTTKHKVWIFKTCPWKSESLRAQTDPNHEHTSNSVVLSVKFCLPWNTSFLVTNINRCPKQK